MMADEVEIHIASAVIEKTDTLLKISLDLSDLSGLSDPERRENGKNRESDEDTKINLNEIDSDDETSPDSEVAKLTPVIEQCASQDTEQATGEDPIQEQHLMEDPEEVKDEPIRDHFQMYQGEHCERRDVPNRTESVLPQIATLFLHVLDCGTVIGAGVFYFINGSLTLVFLTLVVLGITLVLTNCMSLYYFFNQLNKRHGRSGTNDGQENSASSCQELRVLYHTEKSWFTAFVIFHIFQFGLLFRILYIIHKMRQFQIGRFKEMNEVIHTLRLLHGFLGSAMQAIFQICIMNVGPGGVYLNLISAITAVESLFSLALVVRSHYRRFLINRLKDRYEWFTEIALFVSPLLTLTARIVALAMFTSYYRWKLFVVLGCHWLVAVLETIYSAMRLSAPVDIKNVLPRCAVTLFIFVARERSIFGKFPWLYDIFLLMENTALFLAWFIYAGGSRTLYGLPLAGLVWGGYIIGVILKLHLFDNKRLSKYITL